MRYLNERKTIKLNWFFVPILYLSKFILKSSISIKEKYHILNKLVLNFIEFQSTECIIINNKSFLTSLILFDCNWYKLDIKFYKYDNHLLIKRYNFFNSKWNNIITFHNGQNFAYRVFMIMFFFLNFNSKYNKK